MANPTTNYGWQMPTSSDLVTDLPADFEVFGQAVDTSLADLKGGTTGQVLSKATNADMDFTWVTSDDANAIQNAIVDAKGDLIAASAADTPARLAVGANGSVLVADSSQATGLKWAKSGNFIGCRVTKTANQTIANNTATNLTFPTETYDTDAFHSTSVNTSRLTIPTGFAGYYAITANVGFDTNATGRRTATIKLNGSTAIALCEITPGSGVFPAFSINTTYSLIDGDFVEIEVFQTSGGNLDVLTQTERTFFQLERVGS